MDKLLKNNSRVKIKKGRLEKTERSEELHQYINVYEYKEDKNLNILNFTDLLSNQISFHTLKSLECVKYIETIEVGEENE